MKQSASVISYNDTNYKPELCGGKGRNLAILTQKGLPVPPWLCITANAYEQYITPCLKELESFLTGLNYETIEDVSQKILVFLQSRRFDQTLQQDILAQLANVGSHKYFAVRSSCCEEDTIKHSFAGLFETYLFVPAAELPKYILNCWQSVFSPRVLSYLYKNQMSPLDLKMAVIVQEMISSKKSGVMFQANPMGKLEEMVIVAGYGLGEGVVSDQIETDTYYYNRISKEIKTLPQEKKSYFTFNAEDGKGVVKKELPKELSNTPVISEAELRRLIELSFTIETIYDHYQDVEWAIDDAGTLFILQSRPITTIPSGPLHLYDNSNIIEGYPGISTPLTFTLVRMAYEINYRRAFIKMGFPEALVDQNILYFSEMIEHIQGRIYYRLTNWYRILALFPQGSRNLISSLDDMLGVKQKVNEVKKSTINWANLRLGIKVYGKLFWLFYRMKHELAKYQIEFKDYYHNARTRLKQDTDNAGLKEVCQSFVAEMPNFVSFSITNDLFLMELMRISKQLMTKLNQNHNIDPNEMLNGLFVGEKDMESVRPVRSLMEMSNMARNSECLKEKLHRCHSFVELESLLLEFPEFSQLFKEHLEKYGDRGIGELKLERSSFRQDPMSLIPVILNYADLSINNESMQSREEKLRTDTEEQLRVLFKGWREILIFFFINKLRFFLRNREMARMDRSRIIGVFREIFIKMANNWVNQNFIVESNDIFYLTYDEVQQFVDCPDKAIMEELILRRKKEFTSYQPMNPVERMWLKGDVTQNFIPQKVKQDSGAQTTFLHGLGCCPGVVTAEAAVLHSPNETINVKNKILVAENTDPGWVYLIIGSSGLIVEKGSLLSHTAIIGRELGVPTIVSVNNATSSIPNGALIKIDGGLGTIELLP